MSETPWTPGPWEVRNKRSVHPVARPFVAVAVAELHDKNAEANARLIAAAPEMAEVLDRFIRPSNTEDGLITLGELLDRSQTLFSEARALLARIRGDAA